MKQDSCLMGYEQKEEKKKKKKGNFGIEIGST
jgi:hypothetical protein